MTIRLWKVGTFMPSEKSIHGILGLKWTRKTKTKSSKDKNYLEILSFVGAFRKITDSQESLSKVKALRDWVCTSMAWNTNDYYRKNNIRYLEFIVWSGSFGLKYYRSNLILPLGKGYILLPWDFLCSYVVLCSDFWEWDFFM